MAASAFKSLAIAEATSPTDRGCMRADRRTAINRYEILDTAPEADFDDIAMLVAQICKTQVLCDQLHRRPSPVV